MTSSGDSFIKFSDSFDLLKALFFMKNHTEALYINLVDIIPVHFPEMNMFKLFYIINSLVYQSKAVLCLKTGALIWSINSFFKGAGWSERECWDMCGVTFLSNKDLRRILTDYGFYGHPLKKDFPLTGYFELRYNEVSKSLMYENVELAQELREFKFSNPWSKK